MSPADGRVGELEEIRTRVVARLRSRCPEMEETILDHVRVAVPDHIGGDDVEYLVGLRAAVIAAIEYGIAGIENGDESRDPVPLATIAQARRAARAGIGLDTVLLRYIAGYTLLEDFVMEEIEGVAPHNGVALRQLRRTQAMLLADLTASISREYRAEFERARRSSGQRLSERIQRLLAGEPVDSGELGYELDAWHLGLIATGDSAEKVVRGLAAELGRDLLLVPRGEDGVWAWLGDRRKVALADAGHLMSAKARPGATLAIGEPAKGVKGFRLTHRQAQASLLVALRKPQWLTRYADVALLALALRDEALARSMVDIYLAPLDSAGRPSPALRQTLRAYFAAERNVTSAAASLGVARQTVENRIRKVEDRLGRLLHTCLPEVELALRLGDLDGFAESRDLQSDGDLPAAVSTHGPSHGSR